MSPGLRVLKITGNVWLMLGHRLYIWPNNNPTCVQCLMYAGYSHMVLRNIMYSHMVIYEIMFSSMRVVRKCILISPGYGAVRYYIIIAY